MNKISKIIGVFLVIVFVAQLPMQAYADSFTYGTKTIPGVTPAADTAKLKVRSDSFYDINAYTDHNCKSNRIRLKIGQTSPAGYHSFHVKAYFRVRVPGNTYYQPALPYYYGMPPYGAIDGCGDFKRTTGTLLIYDKPAV